MPFNPSLLTKLRSEARMSRADFANRLKISDTYLYMIERGIRLPGRELLHRISQFTGVPVGAFLDEELTDMCKFVSETHLKSPNVAGLQKDLVREREEKAEMERRWSETGKIIVNLLGIIGLHEQLRDLMARFIAPSKELEAEVSNMARETASQGVLAFDEICNVLKIKPSTLKKMLGSADRIYRCKFDLKDPVRAMTTEEAGIYFLCFECGYREDHACEGYGENTQPDTIFDVISRLERAGIKSRAEQAKVLEEHYGLRHNPAVIREYVYRNKAGKHVPEGVVNMEHEKLD